MPSLEDAVLEEIGCSWKEPCRTCRNLAHRIVEAIYLWMDSEGMHFDLHDTSKRRKETECPDVNDGTGPSLQQRSALLRQELSRRLLALAEIRARES